MHITDIVEIEAQISPFLKTLLERMEALEARDLPSLTQERRKRLDALNQLLEDPGAPVSEKFRKLMQGLLRLFYQTLDKQTCGFFNPASRKWVPLSKTCLKSLQAAVDMGSKRKPVELIDLPLGRMVIQ